MKNALLVSLLSISAVLGNSISFVDVYRTQTFAQTSSTQTASTGYYFAANLYMQSAGDFNAATLTPPGGSALTLGLDNTGLVFGFSSSNSATLPAFNAAYPVGVYTFSVTDSTHNNPDAPQTAGVTYSDAFATSTPYLTDFAALAGLNPSNNFNVTWDGFTGALSSNNGSFIFFEVYNHTTGTQVFAQDFLASNVTSVIIPGSTLQANTQYDFDLIFSNRQSASYTSGSATFTPVLGSDLRTAGSFTTGSAATPEPALFLTVGAGLLALRIARRRTPECGVEACGTLHHSGAAAGG